MTIEISLVIVNAALCTLVWLVQLVIYPGFIHYGEAELKRWHPTYTKQVSLIIAPLMLAQVVLYGLELFNTPSFISGFSLALVISTWLVTFLIAVPLHNKIDQEVETIHLRRRLVQVNWYRTMAWTGSFLLSIIAYGK